MASSPASNFRKMNWLKEKVALITGGLGGIGLECVKELLKAGLKGVSIVDIDEEKGNEIIKSLNKIYGAKKTIFINCDVSNATNLDNAFIRTVNTYRQLDIVINNASIVNELEWRKCIDVNLKGVIEGTKLAMEKYLPQYRTRRDAIVMNIACAAGFEPDDIMPVYDATKSAIITLGKTLGTKLHFDRTGVTLLTVCPEYTYTSLIGHLEEKLPAYIVEHALTTIHSKTCLTPDVIGQGMIKIMVEGEHGSIWYCTRKGIDTV